MKNEVRQFLRCEEGATAIEYALIAGFLSIAIITAVNSLGISLSGTFTSIANGF